MLYTTRLQYLVILKQFHKIELYRQVVPALQLQSKNTEIPPFISLSYGFCCFDESTGSDPAWSKCSWCCQALESKLKCQNILVFSQSVPPAIGLILGGYWWSIFHHMKELPAIVWLMRIWLNNIYPYILFCLQRHYKMLQNNCQKTGPQGISRYLKLPQIFRNAWWVF